MKSNILNEYKVNNDLIDKVRTEGGIILKQLKK
jgi:hypothetical protein